MDAPHGECLGTGVALYTPDQITAFAASLKALQTPRGTHARFDDEGRILGRSFEIVLNSGAYADSSPLVLTKAVHRCFGPYRVPNLKVVGISVYTNTAPGVAYRGFGASLGNLAGETNLDQAAERLGIDHSRYDS